MKAMILAAGRGERMMPLTAHQPKPMLNVLGKPLIQYHIENLAKAGITDIVINHAWCGNILTEYLGKGDKFGVNITYSDESQGALETAGGIIKALGLLTNDSPAKNSEHEPFLVINGDVFCSMDFSQLPSLNENETACLWLVDNPEHNPSGDFLLKSDKVINKKDSINNETPLTFSGIAIYKARFFYDLYHVADVGKAKLALGPLLRGAAEKNKLKGIKLKLPWTDVGTPERLTQLNNQLSRNSL